MAVSWGGSKCTTPSTPSTCTAGGDVGGGQRAHVAASKQAQRSLALHLRPATVESRCRDTQPAQMLDQPIGAVAGPAEHDRRVRRAFRSIRTGSGAHRRTQPHAGTPHRMPAPNDRHDADPTCTDRHVVATADTPPAGWSRRPDVAAAVGERDDADALFATQVEQVWVGRGDGVVHGLSGLGGNAVGKADRTIPSVIVAST
jgi:hypothetical protein